MVLKSMFDVFKNRNYLRLFLANFASALGDVTGMTALTFYMLNRFGEQPYYTNLMQLMYSLPTLVVFFLVGVLADRMDRQKITVNTDWIRAVLTIGLLGAIWVGWMPLIFAILFLRAGVAKFFYPAQSTLVQGILQKDEYATAYGLNSMTQSVFMLCGSAIGAFCYWTIGVEGALLVDALSFVASALLIGASRIPQEVRLPNGTTHWRDLKVGMVFQDLKEGSLYILRHRLLLNLMLGLFILGFVNGGMVVLPLFLLKYKLAPDMYEQLAVYMNIAFGLGYLIGSPISSMLTKKIPLYKLMIFGFFFNSAFTVVAGLSPHAWVFVAVNFWIAVGITLVNIPFFGWFPQIVEPKMMGRVEAWKSPLMLGAQSLTLVIISWLFPKYVGVEALFVASGVIMFVVSFFYLFALPKLAKAQDKTTELQPVATGVSS